VPVVKQSHPLAHKPVVIRKLDHSLLKGFVDPASFLRPKAIEVLDREGRLLTVPLDEIKGVFFVREFEGNPRRPERKIFRGRPRIPGLWVRMTFRDHEVLEGVLPNNLLELNSLGFLATPPDLRSNNLKAFVPRTALNRIDVLDVISSAAVRRNSSRPAATKAGSARRATHTLPMKPPIARQPAKKVAD
jgi:hypothetical protein